MVKQSDEGDRGCGFGLSMSSHSFKRPGAATAQVQHPSVHKAWAQRPSGSQAPRGETRKLRRLHEQHISPEPAQPRLFSLAIPLLPSLHLRAVPRGAGGSALLARQLLDARCAGLSHTHHPSVQPSLLRAALLLLPKVPGERPASTSGSPVKPRSIHIPPPGPACWSSSTAAHQGLSQPWGQILPLPADKTIPVAPHSQVGSSFPPSCSFSTPKNGGAAPAGPHPHPTHPPPQRFAPSHQFSEHFGSNVFANVVAQSLLGVQPLSRPPGEPIVGVRPPLPPQFEKAARGTVRLNIWEGSCPWEPLWDPTAASGVLAP